MLTLVPTPIGNIEDITLRTLEIFRHADTILCEDTRVIKKLLSILSERYHLKTHFKKIESLHSHNEDAFLNKIDPSFFDDNVIYVSDAGMPGISDPGQKLVAYCQKNAIVYDILPGANAALVAFVASGFVETQMLFYGFLPHKGGERNSALQQALESGFVSVFYESPHRLVKLLHELQVSFPKRELFLAKELTKKFQTFYKGTPQTCLQQVGETIKGEWVVVVSASISEKRYLSEKEILEADLPIKSASKLIAKITGESSKACYQRLLESQVR